MLKQHTNWIRTNTMIDPNTEELLEHWKYDNSSTSYSVLVRHFCSTWGMTNLISITKKIDNEIEAEPNMGEKNFVLNGLNIVEQNQIALEVFPKKDNIIDRYNTYHIWLLKKQEFPYYVKIKKSIFWLSWKKVEVNGIKLLYKKYTKRVGKQKYDIYYVKAENNKELIWYEKQNFKDYVIGNETIAVEYISKEANSNIATLVCVPKLVFGLR